MATTVVNIRGGDFDVYIGRKRAGQHFGNPFSHKQSSVEIFLVASREESIRAFKAWLQGTEYQGVQPERRQWILDNLHTLRNKKLGCYCKPLSCHGDVLAELADGV